MIPSTVGTHLDFVPGEVTFAVSYSLEIGFGDHAPARSGKTWTKYVRHDDQILVVANWTSVLGRTAALAGVSHQF